MEVLLLTSFFLPGYKGGGPIKSITNLIESTSERVNYKVIASDRDLGDELAYSDVAIGRWNIMDNYSVFYAEIGLIGLKQLYNLMSKKEYDVVYLNSFFSIRFSFIPLLLAKIFDTPIVLAPRGELSEGALTLKKFKKKIYIKAFKSLGLTHGVVFQASSNFESIDIKKCLGYDSNVFVAQNIASQEYTNNIGFKDDAILKLVFISRITPNKNISYALNVLKNINCSVTFDIYGPQEDLVYWKACEEIIKKLPRNVAVNYKGQLKPVEVVDTLSMYDLFFMPTRGENYGHVIAEALCAGLPILISDATPWRDLEDKGIGWDISLKSPEKYSLAIEKAFLMSAESYKEYRESVLSWTKAMFSNSEAVNAHKTMFRLLAENR